MPKDPSVDRPELEVKPNPKLEKRTRRTFTAEYKLRIIREADTCNHGEIGPCIGNLPRPGGSGYSLLSSGILNVR